MQVFWNVTTNPLPNSYQIYPYLQGMYDRLRLTDPEEGIIILRNNSNYFKKNINEEFDTNVFIIQKLHILV
jgi:hypothetical protein